MAIGWRMIKQNKQKAHERAMVGAAISALLFFIIYLSRTIFIGNAVFAGPDHLKTFYFFFLIFHIILATAGAIFGLVTLTLAFRKSFQRHKKIGPWTAIIWFLTAITGVTVNLLLYVIYPSEETTSLIRAILGQ